MTMAIDQPPPPRVKRWTKCEYNELVEHGAFRGQHVYLFRGEIIERSQHHHAQAYAIMELTAALHKVFGVRADFAIRIQLPFDAPGESMPDPDGLVCTEAQSTRRPHPDKAVLMVEVADSSLHEDRERALEFAAAKVPEYWIIDVNNRRLEVFRDPVPDAATPLGFRYASMKIVHASQSVEPIAKPGARVPIAQFFH
jgi:Uma2 family endonuclease